jgi:hypothetical protein
VHDECRVIEVARAAVSQPGGDRFEDLPIEANGVASGTERQPVEIHGRTRSDLRDHIPIVSENSDDDVGYDTESGCGKAAVQHRALDKQEGCRLTGTLLVSSLGSHEPSCAGYAGGTANTGRSATCRSRCVTLPSSKPEIGPCPRVPTTMTSASASLAASAIA